MYTNNMLNQAIANKLYACREERKMSIIEFSKFLGVGDRLYRNYEDGFTKPRLNKLISFCNKLEVTLNDMLGL